MANARGIDALFSIVKGATWGTAPTMNAALAGKVQRSEAKGRRASALSRELALDALAEG